MSESGTAATDRSASEPAPAAEQTPEYTEENRRAIRMLTVAGGVVLAALAVFAGGVFLGASDTGGELLSMMGFDSSDPVPLSELETDPVERPERGALAPDFHYRDLDGNTGRLSDLRGKRVLLNFWATWCPPCEEEMPLLVENYRRYRSTWDFEVLALATSNKSSEQKVRDFAEEYELNFPVLYDLDNDTFQRYDIYSFPTTYVIDREGRVDAIHIGPLTGEDVQYYFGPGAEERDFSEQRSAPEQAPDTVTSPDQTQSALD